MLFKILTVGPLATNVYIIGSEESKEAIVIDAGAEGALIVDELRTLGVRSAMLVSTHGHADHTAAVTAVKEATGAVYGIHEGDVSMLRGGGRLREIIPDFQEPPEPDRFLKDGDTLQVGAVSVRVLETPGHTPGSICLYVPPIGAEQGEQMVFTGDTLFQMSIGRTDFPGGSQPQEITSIATKLLVLPDATVVYPGHGPQTTIADERRWNPFLSHRPRMTGG